MTDTVWRLIKKIWVPLSHLILFFILFFFRCILAVQQYHHHHQLYLLFNRERKRGKECVSFLYLHLCWYVSKYIFWLTLCHFIVNQSARQTVRQSASIIKYRPSFSFFFYQFRGGVVVGCWLCHFTCYVILTPTPYISPTVWTNYLPLALAYQPSPCPPCTV